MVVEVAVVPTGVAWGGIETLLKIREVGGMITILSSYQKLIITPILDWFCYFRSKMPHSVSQVLSLNGILGPT